MSEQPPQQPPYGEPPYGSPPPAAWPPAPGYGQTILPAPDLLGAGPGAGRRRTGRAGVVIGSIATVVAVTAGVAAYAAMQLRGGGRQPETLAPASSFAFAKVDLDPAAGQKLAVRDLAAKLPSAPDGEFDEMVDEFLRTAMQDDDDVDYDRDVEPWLGDRIGIAGFAGADGTPQVLGIIASKDDDEAERALPRLAATDEGAAAYRLRDGYVLVAQDDATLALALSELERGSLSDGGEYGDDVKALTGDQIVTAWVDVERAFATAAAELGEDSGEIPAEVRDKLKGRFALGVHAASDYVEVEGVSVGGGADGLSSGYPALLAGLPDTTVAAMSASGVGDQVSEALDAAGAYPMLPSREEIARQVQDEVGLDLETDLLPLFGAELALALGEVPDLGGAEIPDVALLSSVEEPARAAKVAAKIQDLAAAQGLPVHSRVVGSTFFMSSDPSYVGALTRRSGGRLEDSPRFRKAVGELDETTAFVMYADLGRLLTLARDTEVYADLAPLTAVGVRAGVDDGVGYFRLRLVVE